VSGIADEDRVEGLRRPAEEPQLRPRESQRCTWTGAELVALPFPHADVPLDHLDAGAAQTRDHLGVAGVVALVRPEVEDAHPV
jgi:hypothetical protein